MYRVDKNTLLEYNVVGHEKTADISRVTYPFSYVLTLTNIPRRRYFVKISIPAYKPKFIRTV